MQLLVDVLGEDRVHELRSQGQALDRDQGVPYALAEIDIALADPAFATA